jgi:hypothetical protein
MDLAVDSDSVRPLGPPGSVDIEQPWIAVACVRIGSFPYQSGVEDALTRLADGSGGDRIGPTEEIITTAHDDCIVSSGTGHEVLMDAGIVDHGRKVSRAGNDGRVGPGGICGIRITAGGGLREGSLIVLVKESGKLGGVASEGRSDTSERRARARAMQMF